MTKWLPRLFWTLAGCALVALVAVLTARAVLQRHPAEVSAKLSEALAKHIPDAEAEFASAQLRLSLRGFLLAHVRDLRLRRGQASINAPIAEIWLQGGGLVARLRSPTIQFAPPEKGGVFPAIALGGFKAVAAHNAVLSAPLPAWGQTTLRGVNLTAAQKDNGDVLLKMQNNESGRTLSLEVAARKNFTFSARAFAAGFPPPPNFPARWSGDAGANIWAEVDLKTNRWRIAVDAESESASWQNIGAAKNLSIRAVVSRGDNSGRIALNSKAQSASWQNIGEAANLSVRVFADESPEGFAATVFADGEDLKLERLTLSGLADADNFLSHAELKKFFTNAEVSRRGNVKAAKILAQGEGVRGVFGDAVSLRLRVDGVMDADDSILAKAALAARDVFSPHAGSALTVNITASVKRAAGATLRATFLAELGDAEFAAMPLDAPAFRALRAFGDFYAAPDNEWRLHFPWMQLVLGDAEADGEIDAPSVSSFPIRVEAEAGAKAIASADEPLAPSGAPSAEPAPAAIRASLLASGLGGRLDDWKASAIARDLQAGEIWRYISEKPEWADLREWFRESLPEGVVSRARFSGGRGDSAELRGVFEGGRIVIGDGWPHAENLSGAFSFANESVSISGEGDFDGLPIQDVSARIPAVYADSATLHLDILPAPQPLPRYLQTALDLPQGGDYREAMSAFKLDGRGALAIAARIPLAAGTTNRFAASLTIADGHFANLETPDLPAFESASGAVVIADDGAYGNFTGRVRESPAALTFNDAGGFELRARMDAAEALKIAGLKFPADGTLDFALSRRDGMTLFSSDLRGVALSLPAPLGKPADSAASVWARLSGREALVSARINGNAVNAVLHELKGGWAGAVGVNAPAGAVPASGFRATGGAGGADLDGWMALAFADGPAGSGGAAALTLTNATALGRAVSALTLTISALSGQPAFAAVSAPDFRGFVSLDFDAGTGLAELAYVNLPGDSEKDEKADAESDDGAAMFFTPRDFVLTATITELRRDGELLGGGGGVIRGTPNSWRLSDGVLTLGENRLIAEADYYAGGAPQTSVSLHLSAGNLSGLARGLGFGDFVQRGVLTVSGRLRWPLSPAELGFAKMSGKLRVDASDIVYQQTQGGGGGAVKGVVNFLSVFSPLSLLTLGFLKAGQREATLDRVACNIEIEGGVAKFPGVRLENEDVVINMTGETDLVNRRHNLRGEVKPGDRILKAVGPALWATGQLPALVVVEVVRRVFEKPLSNLGAYEYEIRGDWDNPEYKELEAGEGDN